MLSSERARFDRLVGATQREMHIVLDSVTALVGPAPARGVLPWESNLLRRVVAPCPAKITVISVPVQAQRQYALPGEAVPQRIEVQIPDLQARCKSPAFFSCLDVFNTVLLAPRPAVTDTAVPIGTLFSELAPEDILERANALLLQSRLIAQDAAEIQDEMATLYGPDAEVTPSHTPSAWSVFLYLLLLLSLLLFRW